MHLYVNWEKGVGQLKAQLADILEAQGSDLDHGGLRSPMAEDRALG